MYIHLYSEREREGDMERETVGDFLYVHTCIFRETDRVGDFSLCTYTSIFREREGDMKRERVGVFLYVRTSIFTQRKREPEGAHVLCSGMRWAALCLGWVTGRFSRLY